MGFRAVGFFSKIKGTIFGVPKIGIMIYGGLYGGPPH